VTVTLRPAVAGDAPLLLAWRNDAGTRRWSFSRDAVAPAEHAAWLAARLADPATLLLVGVDDGAEPVGQVRLDREADGAGVGVVSITVAPAARGRGLGLALLTALAARDDLGVATLRASVLPGNARSLALFARAGYREVERTAAAVVLERAVPAQR
jgi:RimJ/RimL family protein N-acetyltransferase